MRKLKFFLAMSIIMQLSCNALGSLETSSPVPETNSTPSATGSVEATSVPSATVTAEPKLILLPVIAPELFGQAKVLHEYWPVIREAAGLWETAPFGTSQTAWALSPDGRYIAVAGCDAEAGNGSLNIGIHTDCEETVFETVSHAYLFILDAETGSIIATLPETGQVLTVTHLAFTHDGNKLLYSLTSGKVQVWDIASGKIQSVISEDGAGFSYFDISPDDKWIALYADDLVRIWDMAEENFVVEIPSLGPAFFSADGQKLLVGDHPFLVVYSTGTWQKLSEQVMMPDGNTNTYDISPDLSLLAVCDTRLPDKPVHIWNVASGEKIQTLEGVWGRCGRLIFSPDSNLLLRFDDHGAGPVIWEVDGWKLVQANANATNFVGSGDLFVDWMEFSQDGTSVLVNTFERLTLYSLPNTAVSLPAGTSAPSTSGAATSLPTVPARAVLSCDMTVHGWLSLHVQPCLPPSGVNAGHNLGEESMIWIKDSEFTGVVFEIPNPMLDELQPRTYVLGDYMDYGNITATFDYYNPASNRIEDYISYGGGTLVLTEVGSYISGTFSFGARDINKRQINVEGSFENIPFSRVNTP